MRDRGCGAREAGRSRGRLGVRWEGSWRVDPRREITRIAQFLDVNCEVKLEEGGYWIGEAEGRGGGPVDIRE